jgi:hypothetical protein
MPALDYGPVDFIRSPSKNLSACHQMQHLFLQGVGRLLQFVPGHVTTQQAKDVVACMIEVRVHSARHNVENH